MSETTEHSPQAPFRPQPPLARLPDDPRSTRRRGGHRVRGADQHQARGCPTPTARTYAFLSVERRECADRGSRRDVGPVIYAILLTYGDKGRSAAGCGKSHSTAHDNTYSVPRSRWTSRVYRNYYPMSYTVYGRTCSTARQLYNSRSPYFVSSHASVTVSRTLFVSGPSCNEYVHAQSHSTMLGMPHAHPDAQRRGRQRHVKDAHEHTRKDRW